MGWPAGSRRGGRRPANRRTPAGRPATTPESSPRVVWYMVPTRTCVTRRRTDDETSGHRAGDRAAHAHRDDRLHRVRVDRLGSVSLVRARALSDTRGLARLTRPDAGLTRGPARARRKVEVMMEVTQRRPGSTRLAGSRHRRRY